LAVPALRQLLKQLPLFFGQDIRSRHENSDNLVAAAPVLQMGNALIPEPEISAASDKPAGILSLVIAFQRRHSSFRAQSCLGEVYR